MAYNFTMNEDRSQRTIHNDICKFVLNTGPIKNVGSRSILKKIKEKVFNHFLGIYLPL